ncbi:hypothetical protein Glove_251g41 [Diversispora epigaea]|uniref:Uncharacterized protein n=1 Tax=Diversispora epigaea TaxID=1348612 RepID=A0A397IGP8_9GLOM|nr:hypothetical protein Glove_251g41 [Diversispora epigaea]
MQLDHEEQFEQLEYLIPRILKIQYQQNEASLLYNHLIKEHGKSDQESDDGDQGDNADLIETINNIENNYESNYQICNH